MSGDRFAEWMLSQVTPRDRAAATVGDLAEDAATRGRAWFWRSVITTALTHLLRGIGEAPFRLFGCALLGEVSTLCLYNFAFLPGTLKLQSALGLDHLARPYVTLWYGADACCCMILGGYIMGRLSGGREWSAWLVFAILSWTFISANAIATGNTSWLLLATPLAWVIPPMLGLVEARRRARRPTPPPAAAGGASL